MVRATGAIKIVRAVGGAPLSLIAIAVLKAWITTASLELDYHY